MNRIKVKAFTLAEVLVTLMIIGVISALTIPSLKESADRNANKAALQKAYSTASNAFAALKAEYGAPMYWMVPSDADIPDDYRGQRVFRNNADKGISWMLQKKINVGQAQDIPPSGYQIKTLSGSNFAGSSGEARIESAKVWFGNKLGQVSFQSADNMYWFPSHGYTGCQHTATVGDFKTNVCSYIVVDTNGSKGPNRMGIDVFVFDITPDGVIPHVGADDCKDMSGNGYTCSAKLINGDEHALDFIYE